MEEEEKAKFKRKTREPLEKEIELSQISNWTGESIVDINIKKKKEKKGPKYPLTKA